VNSEPFRLADVVGEKVILIDFMTYSCINCQRTFPSLVRWHEAYSDDGLLIVGIHTPEFAFERDKENVKKALDNFGITFPVVLDNEYATWRAYENRFWPHKYLIDIHGNIVYDHIGEGAYAETEAKIVELLNERKEVVGEEGSITVAEAVGTLERSQAQSRETYFGARRNERLGNGEVGREGVQTLVFPEVTLPDTLYFHGSWHFFPEYAESLGNTGRIRFHYTAQKVFWVAGADGEVQVEVLVDGEPIPERLRGSDVDETGMVSVAEHRLYTLVEGDGVESHTLELVIPQEGLEAFTFTFG
jgi:thiol-disulfide isomerase/thioredoxin